MTEREPFAKVVRKPNLHGIDAYLVACDGHPVEVDGDPVSAYIAAELTNASHEARIKEAVKKAVEEFRERAARRIESADVYELAESGKPGDRPEFLEPSFSATEWLANEVRKLPTEPEGK